MLKNETISTKNKTANINVRTSRELKDKVDKIFHTLGISASEAINLFYSNVLINEGIPFEVSTKPSKNLLKSIKEHKEGKTTTYKNVEDIRNDLGL